MESATIQLNPETASEYDYVIALDASGSMNEKSDRDPSKTRWTEAQELIFGLASVVSQFDDDGIDIVLFGGAVEVFEGVTPDKVSEIFRSRTPYGGTPLGEAIREIDKLNGDGKKAVAFVLTDGAPNNRDDAVQAIITASNKLERDEDFSIQFIQVGRDPGAAEFLAFLDDGLQAKGAKFDIVDTLTADQAERLSPIDLINKAIND